MLTALLSGENKKKDGTFRQWCCVEYHGDIQCINDVSTIQVVEQKDIRQLNMSTFTGTVLLDNEELCFFIGDCVSKEVYNLLINLPF
jgi:hypothetical protein